MIHVNQSMTTISSGRKSLLSSLGSLIQFHLPGTTPQIGKVEASTKMPGFAFTRPCRGWRVNTP